jgi:hypothetical protein
LEVSKCRGSGFPGKWIASEPGCNGTLRCWPFELVEALVAELERLNAQPPYGPTLEAWLKRRHREMEMAEAREAANHLARTNSVFARIWGQVKAEDWGREMRY